MLAFFDNSALTASGTAYRHPKSSVLTKHGSIEGYAERSEVVKFKVFRANPIRLTLFLLKDARARPNAAMFPYDESFFLWPPLV